MKTIKLVAVLTLTSFVGQAFAGNEPVPNYQLLSQRRTEVVLPEYDLETKKIVLDQVRLVMKDLFVHRELKISHFGEQVNPLPLLDKVEAKLGQLSTGEFHQAIGDIFNKQKDWHTTYHLPKPYSCYRNLLPFTFNEVVTNNGPEVVVDLITESKEALEVLPEPLQIKVGDTLVSYNGFSVEETFKKIEPRAPGANPAAVKRSILFMLTMLTQKYELAPTMDSVKLVMKNSMGEIYETTVPWISRARQDCLEPKPESGNIAVGSNDFLIEYKQMFRKIKKLKRNRDGKALFANGFNATAEPTLTWKLIQNENGTFGVIKLESFVPEKLSVPEVVIEIKNLLLNQLAKTEGMILDLRDNGGGQIGLGEALVQLFSPRDIQPLDFVLRASPANKHFMDEEYQNNPFYVALNNAILKGETFAAPIPLSSTKFLNNQGQVYFKPLALFTNANCYSTCDIISAQMQDHEAALIAGEDNTTGAGGANNTNLMGFYEDLAEDNKGPFKKMPHDQDIGFSWRQTVRIGKSAGVLIEDTGVLSDLIVPTTLADVFNQSASQYKIITDSLAKRAANNRSSAYFQADTLELTVDEKPAMFMKWSETSSIQFLKAGSVIKTIEIEENSPDGRNIDLSEVINNSSPFFETLEIRGFHNGNRVWRRILNFRIIPKTFVLPEDGLNIDFSNSHPMALYGLNGWNVLNESLKIDNGILYKGDVKADASIFVNLNRAAKLSFDAEITTELDYDYFRVVVVSEGKETLIEKGLSGHIEMKKYSYDLSQFIGKNVEIRLVFESDGWTEDVGVTLDNIVIH